MIKERVLKFVKIGVRQGQSKFSGDVYLLENHPKTVLNKKTQNIFLQPIATLPKGFTFAVP